MKTHLAKIYLFDYEYKGYFGNVCFYKLKHDIVISVIFIITVILFEVSLGYHHSCCRSSPSRFMVIPSKQGVWGTCCGQ